mgnify:CR=1 FL=1
MAAVTHRLPGPTTASTAPIGPDLPSIPYTIAPIACAPPTASSPSAPAIAAAASVTGAGLGLATHTVPTPAARAVATVISTLDGSGYRPPGA